MLCCSTTSTSTRCAAHCGTRMHHVPVNGKLPCWEPACTMYGAAHAVQPVMCHPASVSCGIPFPWCVQWKRPIHHSTLWLSAVGLWCGQHYQQCHSIRLKSVMRFECNLHSLAVEKCALPLTHVSIRIIAAHPASPHIIPVTRQLHGQPQHTCTYTKRPVMPAG